MSRDRGFLSADISTGLLTDPKLRAVRRRLAPDTEAGAYAVLTYIAVVLDSWRNGERLRLPEALPDWMEALPSVAEALVAEGLLDKHQRIPAKVWEGWYGVADARREQARDAGRRGGVATAERRLQGRSSGAASDPAATAAPDRLTNQQTDYPTNSPLLPRARARAKDDGLETRGPTSLRELLPPPPGHPVTSGDHTGEHE